MFAFFTGPGNGTRISPMIAALLYASIFPVRADCAQSPIIERKLPNVTETTAEGKRQTVTPRELASVEIDLYQRFQTTDPPQELFALLTSPNRELAEFINRGTDAEVRLYPDDCAIRYFHRKLTTGEMAQLRRFVMDKKVDNLPEYTTDICDGVEYGYLHFTKEGGYRLWMNNPPDADEFREHGPGHRGRVYAELVQLLQRLADPERLTVKYLNRRLLPDLEVMYAHPTHEIRAVWAKGDDIRVLVGDFQMTGEQWQSLRDGKLGPSVEQPAVFPPDAFLDRREARSLGMQQMCDDCQPWQARWGKNSVRGGSPLSPWTPPATWICQDGREPIRLLESPISNQLVTTDGRWLVGTCDEKLVCYNLAERKMVPIDKPQAVARFLALDYWPVDKKVLLVRPWQEGPREESPLPRGYGPLPSKFRLLDPATGKTEEAEDYGYANHLRQRMHRPFQPAKQPGVVWMSFKGDDYSMLGRFDTKPPLRFRNWMRIESLEFESDHMWVDEASRRIYIIYRGHLLRLPLPKRVLDDSKD